MERMVRRTSPYLIGAVAAVTLVALGLIVFNWSSIASLFTNVTEPEAHGPPPLSVEQKLQILESLKPPESAISADEKRSILNRL